ncbi:MAG: hypothetical protein IH584_08110 [Candidatus Aminicenantes bacterium]|nr:hypothetical protein [Candidatus Aminicenantes bacterium]
MNINKGRHRTITAAVGVFFIFFFLSPLHASRERRGATVEVTMTDGSKVRGELLAVKTDTLLVYDRTAGQGKIIELRQVDRVKVLKKTKFGEGLLIGLVVGVGISFFNSHILKSGMSGHESFYFGLGLSVFPPITGLCGGLLGELAGIDKKLSLAGKSFERVQQNLLRLKRHAREQD